MLVVLVIIGFATTVSVLAYKNYRKTATIRGAAERIKSMIVEARTRAIADNQPSSVTFDLDRQSVWIDDLTTSGGIRTPKAIAPEYIGPEIVIESVRLNSTAFPSGIRRATFNPDGTNAFLTINLRREYDDASVDENYFSIQIYPNSAEPRVWPNERK